MLAPANRPLSRIEALAQHYGNTIGEKLDNYLKRYSGSVSLASRIEERSVLALLWKRRMWAAYELLDQRERGSWHYGVQHEHWDDARREHRSIILSLWLQRLANRRRAA